MQNPPVTNEPVSDPAKTVVCTRPFDYPVYQNFFPVFKHTFFRTTKGDFGFQFCDKKNQNCPMDFGPRLMGDTPVYDKARNPRNYRCVLISDDPEFRKCIERKAEEIIPNYTFIGEYHAVINNACGKFVDDVIKQCKREDNADQGSTTM